MLRKTNKILDMLKIKGREEKITISTGWVQRKPSTTLILAQIFLRRWLNILPCSCEIRIKQQDTSPRLIEMFIYFEWIQNFWVKWAAFQKCKVTNCLYFISENPWEQISLSSNKEKRETREVETCHSDTGIVKDIKNYSTNNNAIIVQEQVLSDYDHLNTF